MRTLVLTMMTIGAVAAIEPAAAQTFDPRYPVCMHVYGDPTYYECQYMTMAACMATASSRAAQCIVNLYMASAAVPPGSARRYGRAY